MNHPEESFNQIILTMFSQPPAFAGMMTGQILSGSDPSQVCAKSPPSLSCLWLAPVSLGGTSHLSSEMLAMLSVYLRYRVQHADGPQHVYTDSMVPPDDHACLFCYDWGYGFAGQKQL